MTNKIFITLFISSYIWGQSLWAVSDELALTQCEEQGHHFGDGSGVDKINSECIDFFKRKANSLAQANSNDNKLSVFGHRNIIFLDHIKEGDQHKVDVIAGTMTKLAKLQALALDELHHELAVLNESSDILFFSTMITGNVAPYRILKTKDLYGAKNLIVDAQRDQVIVHNPELKQLLFFSRLGNIDAPKGRKRLELIKAMDIDLTGELKMSIDSKKRELDLIDAKGTHQLIKIQ